MAVFANVFLGMQIPLSSYLQVCFSMTNDVVMSISLMYEKPESGERIVRAGARQSLDHFSRLNVAQASQCSD